jgi:hypothetical protein
MLRASQKVTLTSNTIEFENGFILSTILDLNGLIIRANQPLAQPIKDFLIPKNIKINRIRVAFLPDQDTTDEREPHYEYYIRIYGTFSISKAEISAFINQPEYIALSSTTDDEITDMPVASKLQSLIEKKYDTSSQEKIAVYTDKMHIWEVPAKGIFVGKSFHTVTVEFENNSSVFGKDAVIIQTEKLISNGQTFYFAGENQNPTPINVGLMAPFYSKNLIDIKAKNTIKLDDTILEAKNIFLQSSNNDGTLELSINTNIDWLNNPCHDFISLFKFKSGVQQCELDTCTTEDGSQKNIITKLIPRPGW